jgi:PAS domain-containing protein
MCQDAQLLAQLVESSPEIMGAFDSQGRLTYLNRKDRERLGLAGDFPGEGGSEGIQLYPRAAAVMIKEVALPAAARGGLWRGESILRDSAGREWPVEQTIYARRNADGSVEGFFTIIREIGMQRLAEKALRDSEERFSKAFYASPDPYVIVDHTTHLMVDVNDAYCQRFGVSRE